MKRAFDRAEHRFLADKASGGLDRPCLSGVTRELAGCLKTPSELCPASGDASETRYPIARKRDSGAIRYASGKRGDRHSSMPRMQRWLGRFSPYIYALLRIAAGFLFFQHGLPKLFGGFGRPAPAELMSQMGLAGIIEVVGGALISIGLFTSPVAFIASGEMAVA